MKGISVVPNEFSASAVSAGALFSTARFEVPIYQREYSWTTDEVKEFWDDLRQAKADSTYFLGLVILTESGDRFQVVDGQQRILTLTLLAVALRDEARRYERDALAEKLESDFLRVINYQTDEMEPRVMLSGELDSSTLEQISAGAVENVADDAGLSEKIIKSFLSLKRYVQLDIAPDPFKRLGEWAAFLTGNVFFAVFKHPDPASAYRVFEAINTRGRSLTTADLLKNFLLSQTPSADQKSVYERWQQVAEQFDSDSGTSFVQYIRHVVTVQAGHILPKQLYDYLAKRGQFSEANPPTPLLLLRNLEDYLPLYSQMMDPSVGGPAGEQLLDVYRAFNQLSVITVRPILLALSEHPNCLSVSKDLLRLVVRRIVVGNLGTGNVERRLGDTARKLKLDGDWDTRKRDLADLNPTKEDFIAQIGRRSFNKTVLSFLRKAVVERTITPNDDGALHLIRIKGAPDWGGFDEEELSYWANTIGNTILTRSERRPPDALSWDAFKRNMLPDAVEGEFADQLSDVSVWNAEAVEAEGKRLAMVAANVWYE